MIEGLSEEGEMSDVFGVKVRGPYDSVSLLRLIG